MRKQRGSGSRASLERTATFVATLVVLSVHACTGGGQRQSADRAGGAGRDSTVATTQTPLPPGSSVDPGPRSLGAPVRVLFIGTSLTAGFGLPDPAEAWPGQLGRIADSLGYKIAVQNAGLSGETSAGALRRTDWLLRDSADVVVIETGANDGLRGTSVGELQDNLAGIVKKVRAARPTAQIVLVQMEAPPNLGGSYASGFHSAFPAVAKSTGAMLMPFLLDGVAGVSSLNQSDGIHPTAAGAARAAQNAWPTIRAALDKVKPVVPAI
jgi:acyl-CoA thioesterase I